MHAHILFVNIVRFIIFIILLVEQNVKKLTYHSLTEPCNPFNRIIHAALQNQSKYQRKRKKTEKYENTKGLFATEK